MVTGTGAGCRPNFKERLTKKGRKTGAERVVRVTALRELKIRCPLFSDRLSYLNMKIVGSKRSRGVKRRTPASSCSTPYSAASALARSTFTRVPRNRRLQ